MGAYVITCTSKFRVLWQYHNTHTHWNRACILARPR
jgi:hypothetical protein